MDPDVNQTNEVSFIKSRIGKGILFILVVFVGFILSAIKFPERFDLITDIFPETTMNLKLENRISLILFIVILFSLFKKEYFYLFKIAPLKKKGTYFWIFGLLTVIIFLLQKPASFHLFPLSFIEYIQILLVVSIIVPIEEELFYRGLLILALPKKYQYIMAFFSTFLFGLIHDSFWSSIIYGGIFAILAIRHRNLLVPIVAHAIWNLFALFF